MENLENMANQSPKRLLRNNLVYMPIFMSYTIGGAIALAKYATNFVKNDNPSIGEQILAISLTVGYIAGLPLLHFGFNRSVNMINKFSVNKKNSK